MIHERAAAAMARWGSYVGACMNEGHQIVRRNHAHACLAVGRRAAAAESIEARRRGSSDRDVAALNKQLAAANKELKEERAAHAQAASRAKSDRRAAASARQVRAARIVF